MERIQSAIAKGRAARQQGTSLTVPLSQPPATQDTGVIAAWSALPAAVIDQRHFEMVRIVAHQPGNQATAYDLMRTNLMRHLREQNWTRVAVTSPGGACGKTTTCVNLAFSLARQSELRVLVLEMDLRRPAMMKTLGLEGGARMAAVLAGTEPPERGLVRFGTNLAFGVSSAPVANPAELLSSTQAAAAVDAIEERYKPDVIVFDMPPLLVIDDTMAFLDQIDCALMVAASEKTTVSEIDRAGKELADHTTVLGVVLNKCRFMGDQDGYSYAGY